MSKSVRYSIKEILVAIAFYARVILVPFNHLLNFRMRNGMKKSGITDEQRKFWRENGYIILERHFADEQMDQVNSYVQDLWTDRKHSNSLITIDAHIGLPTEKRIFLRDAAESVKDDPYKINDLYLESSLIRNVVLDTRLNDVITELLDGYPAICNSLTFEKGSQQIYHFDTFYMAPVVPNKMVASWIALEDCSPDAGPLTYYPGSHKIPPYRFSTGLTKAIASEMQGCQQYIDAQIQKLGLKPEVFTPRKGDVLIWHAQLLHGGSPIRNYKLTRKSLVTHYFRAVDYSFFNIGKFETNKYFLKRRHQQVSRRSA